jgi:hypothetical protein
MMKAVTPYNFPQIMQGKGGITHSRLPAIEAASEVTGRNHRERARFRSELSDALASLPKLQGRRAADPALDRAVATLLSRVGPRLPPCLPPLPSKGSHVPPAQQTSLLTPGMTTMQRSYLHHPAAMRLSFFQVRMVSTRNRHVCVSMPGGQIATSARCTSHRR